MSRAALTLTLTLTLALALACARTTSFVCSESSDCTDGSFSGVCQSNGYCSFGDDTCPSGQRYGDLAPGELAGTCVEGDGTSSGPDPTTSAGPETTLGTLDDPTLDEGAPEDTTSTGTTRGGESTTDSPVDDASTTAPDPTTLESSDSSDTMLPDNCGMEPMDECNACAYEACCPEIVACSMDEACICFFECTAAGTPIDICAQRCGSSVTHDALDMCILASCGDVCAAMQ